MSLTQLGGESGGQDVTSYPIYQQISKEIKPKIKEEIKKLLKKKITPINDHLESLIYNRKTYWRQDAAKFSNLIKEKLFTKQDKGYKKNPFIFSTTLLELLARVETDDKFYVVDYSFDGFFVNKENNILKFSTGIDIDDFIKVETTKQSNNDITEIHKAYMKEITPKIEEKFENLIIPTKISENDEQQPTELFTPALDAVVEEQKNPPTGGQRRNRKSKKARKTKKARKSRKNRRKSNRRRR